ncbi:hypothetical protein BJY01DRAFT_251180 [Aspergillus pseudoustus]|uniref:Chitin-binding type-2 domain-containing protein n=1 Tax=Aspergillus pseudoustus TaxID=1810923 RepID=A0ABR4JD27_9EURO
MLPNMKCLTAVLAATLLSMPTAAAPRGNEKCEVGATWRDPHDCHAFFECAAGGIPARKVCGPRTAYSPHIGVCDYEWKVPTCRNRDVGHGRGDHDADKKEDSWGGDNHDDEEKGEESHDLKKGKDEKKEEDEKKENWGGDQNDNEEKEEDNKQDWNNKEKNEKNEKNEKRQDDGEKESWGGHHGDEEKGEDTHDLKKEDEEDKESLGGHHDDNKEKGDDDKQDWKNKEKDDDKKDDEKKDDEKKDDDKKEDEKKDDDKKEDEKKEDEKKDDDKKEDEKKDDDKKDDEKKEDEKKDDDKKDDEKSEEENYRLTTRDISQNKAGEKCRVGSVWADPSDCHKFWECAAGGNPVRKTCGPGTAYSEKLGVCDFEGNVPSCRRHQHNEGWEKKPQGKSEEEGNKKWEHKGSPRGGDEKH